MNTRTSSSFSSVYFFLHPSRSAAICFLLFLISLPFTYGHVSLAGFSFIFIWMFTYSIWLERPLIPYFPLPPLTTIFIGITLRCGIGPLLLAFSGTGNDPFLSIWANYGSNAQLLWLVFSCVLLLFSTLNKSLIYCSHVKPPSLSLALKTHLPIVFSVLTAYMCLYLVLSILTGAFDRNFEHYSYLTKVLWRLDTPVIVFSRLRDMWFFLVPISLFILPRIYNYLTISLVLTFFSVSLLSGSRGLIFYPLLIMFFGLLLISKNRRLISCLSASLLLVIFLSSPLIYVARESSLFQSSQSISSRLQSFSLSLTRTELLINKSRWLGRDLYACHDPFLFIPQNISTSPVGFDGLSSLPFIWVPKHFYPDQPTIFDGHLIAKNLQNVTPSDWSEVWFPCFTLPADLYRRWSYQGVVFGSIVAAFALTSLFRLWYLYSASPKTYFHIFILLFPVTYIQSFPFGTVSETSWMLLWDLPKYLIFFLVVDRLLTIVNPFSSTKV